MASESERLAALAEAARDSGAEDQALPQLAAYLARNPGDLLVLHWHALLLRGLDRRDEAIALLEAARRLAPADASLAHSLAQLSLEAGKPASHLFREAIQLAPTRPELRLGLAAARFAKGEGELALSELDGLLAAQAGWYPGHRQFAQLAALAGRGDMVMSSYERAIAAFPDSGQLYFEAAGLLIESERYGDALAMLDRGIARAGEAELLLRLKAGALDELGHMAEAEALFARLGVVDDLAHAVRRQRFLLRRGEAVAAARELEPWLAAGVMDGLWPYAALSWRLAGDPRAAWLEREPFVAVVDLGQGEVDLAALAVLLRRLHAGSGRFLDQSVRQGTQTEGNLLARSEPAIAQLREAMRRAVASYAAQLPEPEPGHPLLARRPGKRVRFAGSWSVRLGDAGFHQHHHHPLGWISSAFYVAVPEQLGETEGRLMLGGSPSDLALGLAPILTVEPRPGRLVIFPSTMWHGTSPFAAGERISVAFDIVPELASAPPAG
jgi:tetratricopeptide (TPR) repeat protein